MKSFSVRLQSDLLLNDTHLLESKIGSLHHKDEELNLGIIRRMNKVRFCLLLSFVGTYIRRVKSWLTLQVYGKA